MASASAFSRAWPNRSSSRCSSFARQVQAAGVAQPGVGGAAARRCRRAGRDAARRHTGWPVRHRCRDRGPAAGKPRGGRGTAPAGGARESSPAVRHGRSSRGTSRLRLLAFDHLARITPCVQPAAQLAEQRGVFAKALDQDRARAVQRGLGVGHALVGIDERAAQVGEASGTGRDGSASRPSASGSSPASRAICARVRRLGLYGR
jgi:hypothetical protein